MHQSVQSTQQNDAKPKPVRTVVIVVNGKDVTVPTKVTGAEIKAAAGVPADFDLFRIKGRKEIPIGHDEQITVTKGDKFVASPTLDPSFMEHPMQPSAVQSVRDAFPGHAIEVAESGDGTALVTVRGVAIGDGGAIPRSTYR